MEKNTNNSNQNLNEKSNLKENIIVTKEINDTGNLNQDANGTVYSNTDSTLNGKGKKRKNTDDANQGSEIKPKKKPCLWNDDWLRDPLLKDDGLQKHPTNPKLFTCKYCVKELRFTRKTDLVTHCKTAFHQDSIKVAKKNGTFVEVEITGLSLKDRTRAVEKSVALFLAEHKVNLKLVDVLVPFMQNLVKNDSDAFLNMKLKRDKYRDLTRKTDKKE